MPRRTARSAFVLLAILPASPALTGEDAAYERAFFRTFTLLHATAPRATIAAATQCAVAATAGFSDGFRQALVAIDRRPVYRGDERFRQLVAALTPSDRVQLKPLELCFARLDDGAFGEIRGAAPATAAPNPDAVAACPIHMDRVSGDEVTCYCQPMLGGIAYGYMTYSDTSSICLAARHAGAIDYLTGGVVRAALEPGCASYEGREANGYPSATETRTARSFHFPTVGRGDCPK